MKKIKFVGILGLAGLLASTLALTGCGNNEEGITKPIYGVEKGEVVKVDECKLVFKENSEIPYISVTEATRILDMVRTKNLEGKNYKVQLKKVGNNYELSNETGAKCVIDKEKKTFTFDDYDKFTSLVFAGQQPLTLVPVGSDSTMLKIVSSDYTAEKAVEISLNGYSKLDMYEKDNRLYLPLSVFNTVLLNTSANINLAYNTKDLFIFSGTERAETLFGEVSETTFGKKFSEGVEKASISKEYAEYYYESLCFDFNNMYGLKDKFTSFDEFVKSHGYKKELASTNPKELDNYTGVTLSWLNDYHTTLSEFSCFYKFRDNSVDELISSPTKNAFYKENENFIKAKKAAGIKEGLEYIGDTAFITFNEFEENNEALFYMTTQVSDIDLPELDLPKGVDPSHTAVLFNELYKQLHTAEHKNIKNVVVDLTANEGGSADSLIYGLSTLLGNVTFDICNPLSGGRNHQVYKADINADGKIDSSDVSLAEQGYNIYFLNSKYSFSSANAMPVVAAINNNKVVNLGAKTAGGPCAVRNYVTPIGSVVSSSGLNTLSKLSNGKYVNIDDGIPADFELTEEKMLDRNYIVQNINSWKK